jgi:peptide deformylase
MKRSVVIYPHPCLRKKCVEISNIDDSVRTLAQDMIETMYAYDGIGLAASQVGVIKQMFVMRDLPTVMDSERKIVECSKEQGAYVFINPVMTFFSQERASTQEGCLSLPDIVGMVERSQKIRMKFQDFESQIHEWEFQGYSAICVQHEVDHLNGKIFIDYLGNVRKAMISEKMRKYKKKSLPHKFV